MSSFAKLKKNRSSQFEKLSQAAEKVNQGFQKDDDGKTWKLSVDKAGNGSAILRFLPAPGDEDVPFVRYWDHGFKGPGGWYIEKSRTTIGEDDPVSELNSRLWNSGIEADKEVARKQKRRLHYVSNVLVIKDSANPENEGKVFLYEYGKKIFDKINDLMHPEFDDVEPVNPFDLWEGANFRLIARQVEGFRNYDKSTFDSPSAISDDDKELEAVWKSEHSLQEIVDPANFKSYDELSKKLQKVLGNVQVQTKAEDEDDLPFEPPKTAPSKPAPKAESTDFDDDDESLDFFKKLAED